MFSFSLHFRIDIRNNQNEVHENNDKNSFSYVSLFRILSVSEHLFQMATRKSKYTFIYVLSNIKQNILTCTQSFVMDYLRTQHCRNHREGQLHNKACQQSCTMSMYNNINNAELRAHVTGSIYVKCSKTFKSFSIYQNN